MNQGRLILISISLIILHSGLVTLAQQDFASLEQQKAAISQLENNLLTEKFYLEQAMNDPDTVVIYYPASERWSFMPRDKAVELADRIVIMIELQPGLVDSIVSQLGLPRVLVSLALASPGMAASQLINLMEASQKPQLESILGDFDIAIAELQNMFNSLDAEQALPSTFFATEMVSFTRGDPPNTCSDALNDPSDALGEPDWTGSGCSADGAITLGCEGSIVLGFPRQITASQITVYEQGAQSEAYLVERSSDGSNWHIVGQSPGSETSFSVSDTVRYVRITDLGETCTGLNPGAEINAVEITGQ